MRELAETCEQIAATTKKLEKTSMVAGFLRSQSPEEAAVAAVFLYTLGANVVERPDGIRIAAFFIAAIVTVSTNLIANEAIRFVPALPDKIAAAAGLPWR